MNDSYEVIALRYRPQKFSALIGQKAAKAVLQGMVSASRIPRVIIIDGPRGLGKTSLARITAAVVNCVQPESGEPCGTCDRCVDVYSGKSSTIDEINCAVNRGIDDAKRLVSNAFYAPRGFKYRVFILDEVHQLTPEAFKALLKLLEEPPPHSMFILCTTEPSKLPPEIHSRAIRASVRPVTASLLVKRLQKIATQEKLDLDEEVLMRIAKASNGFVREALMLLESVAGVKAVTKPDNFESVLNELLGDASDGTAIDFVSALLTGDIGDALKLHSKVYNQVVFCESVVKIASQAVQAAYGLKDYRTADVYEHFVTNVFSEIETNDAGERAGRLLAEFIKTSAALKYFPNEPQAVVVSASLAAAGVVK